MIKVNLASRKQALGAEVGSKSSLIPMGRFKFGLDEFKELPIKGIVLSIIVAVGITFMAGEMKDSKLAAAEELLGKAVAEGKKLETEIDKYKNVPQQQKELEQDLTTIKTKIGIISSLLLDRGNPPKILISIAKSIPKDVWLTDFSMKNTDVSFRGSALGFNQISDFMKNLNEDIYFKDISLRNSQQDKAGSEVTVFELAAKRK